jgi:hypothetical protein
MILALFNSWDRVVYVYDGDEPSTKNGTTMKKNDTISFNWILANYHSSMAIDNDDGTSPLRNSSVDHDYLCIGNCSQEHKF